MIVITTPTGQIGHQVLTGLLDAGEPLRVIARDPSQLPPSIRDHIDVVEGSHGDPVVVEEAFAGADAVFWVAPPNPHADSLKQTYLDFTAPACDAFKSHAVSRVVGVSTLGRGVTDGAGQVTASLAMDDMIAATGVAYRALALPPFMDNLVRQVEPIRTGGRFFSTVGADRKLPTCATRDIAAAAAELLLDDSWSGQGSVAVLGPEDLSHNDMAQIMSEVLERPIRYQQIPLEAFAAQLTERGMSSAVVQGMVEMMSAIDAGLYDAEPRTPESAGPTSFRQWCDEVLRPAVRGQLTEAA